MNKQAYEHVMSAVLNKEASPVTHLPNMNLYTGAIPSIKQQAMESMGWTPESSTGKPVIDAIRNEQSMNRYPYTRRYANRSNIMAHGLQAYRNGFVDPNTGLMPKGSFYGEEGYKSLPREDGRYMYVSDDRPVGLYTPKPVTTAQVVQGIPKEQADAYRRFNTDYVARDNAARDAYNKKYNNPTGSRWR